MYIHVYSTMSCTCICSEASAGVTLDLAANSVHLYNHELYSIHVYTVYIYYTAECKACSIVSVHCACAEIRRFCVAVQKRVLDGIVDREVEKGECQSLLYVGNN